MLQALQQIREFGITLLLALVLATTVTQIIARPSVYLIRKCPLWHRTPSAWSTSHEWVVIFMLVNAGVFACSLSGIEREHRELFLNVLLRHSLTCAQVGSLLMACAFVDGATYPDGHVVPATWWHWTFVLVLTLSANILAVVDSATTFLAHRIGPIHFAIWCVQNAGCIFFFLFLLVALWRGAYAYLNSERPRWLWWLAAILIAASLADFSSLWLSRSLFGHRPRLQEKGILE